MVREATRVGMGDNGKKLAKDGSRIRNEMLVFGRPVMGKDEIAEILKALESCWIGTGPRSRQLERMFAEYVGVKHALATNSCTSAMHLSLVGFGVGPGDEVITSPMTFCATANVIVHCGATPVFADIDPKTWNIDPEQVEAKVTRRTRALLPVHFCGRPCDLEALGTIAERHGLKMISDGAHAVEARYKGRSVGSYGEVCCFSFYANKNITTAEGGMLVTSDDGLARRASALRTHGLDLDAWERYTDPGFRHQDCIEPGFNYNLADLNAAVGIVQLSRIEGWLERRERIWAAYDRAFADLPVTLPSPVDEKSGHRHARHLYTLLVDPERSPTTRDRALAKLKAMNIGCGVHYRAVHEQTYYRERFGLKPGDFPNAARVSANTLSLPLSPELTDGDVDDVIRAVRIVFGATGRVADGGG